VRESLRLQALLDGEGVDAGARMAADMERHVEHAPSARALLQEAPNDAHRDPRTGRTGRAPHELRARIMHARDREKA